MSLLYVTENGATLGINGGRVVVTYKNGEIEEIPKETVSGVALFGQSQVTTQLTKYFLEKGIRVSYFSSTGKYYGMLTPAESHDVTRLKKQMILTQQEDFCLEMAKKIIRAKINNQLTVIRRYSRNNLDEASPLLTPLKIEKNKIEKSTSIEELMGHEGKASRIYFQIINSFLEEDFKFDKRSRRPAKDPVNCMLNFGYALLTKEIIGELENRGLCAYTGFLHQDKPGHASLASDLIEEWRQVIVDSVVLSLIQGHEISCDCFKYENGGCILTQEGMKMFIYKMEKKMFTESKYLSYIDKAVSFRKAIWHQCESIATAIDTGNSKMYNPVIIR